MTIPTSKKTGPVTSPVESYLQTLLEDLREIRDGDVAQYIPELAKADPEHLGIAVATVDGAIYTAGDADTPFTIQSVSKPFMFGYALQVHGPERVMQKVGVEPTGDPFNSITLDEEHNRPFNPMVNAGAIAMVEFLAGASRADKEAEQLEFFSRFAGRPLQVDTEVYRSESETGHRNRAIAYMMLNSGMIDAAPEDVLHHYFRQCSILVTARDLALMAATLAGHGRHPITGAAVLSPHNVRDVLSVMATCGMYNYAGQWMFDVGLPAKSGVCGGILAVMPGQFGVAVYSPRLDPVGNSVRGIAACKRLAADYALHSYADRTDTRNVVRRMSHCGEVRSKRVRSMRDLDTLAELGSQVALIEGQGPLYFGSTERLIRSATRFAKDAHTLVLDLRRVSDIDHAAQRLLAEFAMRFAADGKRLVIAETGEGSNLADLEGALSETVATGRCIFADDVDEALEAEENALLATSGSAHGVEKLRLDEMELFDGLGPEDIAALESAILTFRFEPGETILHKGEEARVIFVVARGIVSILVGDGEEAGRRIASVGPGESFGEMALLDGGPRAANARADAAVLAYGFSVEEVRRLSEARPRIMVTLLSNVARTLTARLRAANDQIRALE